MEAVCREAAKGLTCHVAERLRGALRLEILRDCQSGLAGAVAHLPEFHDGMAAAIARACGWVMVAFSPQRGLLIRGVSPPPYIHEKSRSRWSMAIKDRGGECALQQICRGRQAFVNHPSVQKSIR